MEKLMDLGGMDNYYEQIVKKKFTMQTFTMLIIGFVFAIIGLIGSFVLSFSYGIFVPIAIGLLVLCIWMTWYILKNTRVEYEYTFVTGEMRIERIKNKMRRRKIAAFDVKAIDDIDFFINPETGEKNIDTSKYDLILKAAGTSPEEPTYYVVIHDKVRRKPALLLFSPNETTLQKIRPYLSVELKKKFLLREKSLKKNQ